MAKELKIYLVEKTPDNIHIFRMEGALGVEGAAGIQGLLDACMKARVYRLVLDMGGVSFISSAGMGAFLSAVGELRKKNGDMILIYLPDKIRGVFKNLDVLDYFLVADDVARALERLRGELPRPPSLEELTAAVQLPPVTEDTGFTRTIFSLLAAYADIFDGDAEISNKLSQLVDITANYLALEECAFIPLQDKLGLAAAAARGIASAAPPDVREVLTAALARKEVIAVEQFPGINKEVADWFARSHVHFLFPLEINRNPVAALVVGDKKDGQPIAAHERRIIRYLRASLNLALAVYDAGRKPATPAAEAEKKVERKLMEQETLFAIAQELAEALDIEQMLPTFLMMVSGQFSTARAIILLESEKGPYRVWAARGFSDDVGARLELPPRGLAERLAESRTPQPINVVALMLTAEERPTLAALMNEGIAVLAPMLFKGRLSGILGLGGKISGRDFEPEELKLLGALVNLAAVSIETARLLQKIKDTYSGLVRALITAVEAKDKYTRGHTERVTRYAAALANELEMDEDTRQNLLFGAVLHDVGYIGVPEDVLQMPNGITPEQLAELRRHPEIGVNILRDIPFFGKALEVVRHHHEQYDGKGYPSGLTGENIPFTARVLAVADAFDAMTSERRYRQAKTVGEAAAEIRRNRGTQFDPHIADVFLGLISSGRLGLIKTKS